jgi:hypothetical protein
MKPAQNSARLCKATVCPSGCCCIAIFEVVDALEAQKPRMHHHLEGGQRAQKQSCCTVTFLGGPMNDRRTDRNVIICHCKRACCKLIAFLNMDACCRPTSGPLPKSPQLSNSSPAQNESWQTQSDFHATQLTQFLVSDAQSRQHVIGASFLLSLTSAFWHRFLLPFEPRAQFCQTPSNAALVNSHFKFVAGTWHSLAKTTAS